MMCRWLQRGFRLLLTACVCRSVSWASAWWKDPVGNCIPPLHRTSSVSTEDGAQTVSVAVHT